jgi:hypothetical protein
VNDVFENKAVVELGIPEQPEKEHIERQESCADCAKCLEGVGSCACDGLKCAADCLCKCTDSVGKCASDGVKCETGRLLFSLCCSFCCINANFPGDSYTNCKCACTVACAPCASVYGIAVCCCRSCRERD